MVRLGNRTYRGTEVYNYFLTIICSINVSYLHGMDMESHRVHHDGRNPIHGNQQGIPNHPFTVNCAKVQN